MFGLFLYRDKFSPYLRESFDVVYQALSYPHDDVKSAAIGCMAQICINWYRLNTPAAHNGKYFYYAFRFAFNLFSLALS
jgi:hypothetical protein